MATCGKDLFDDNIKLQEMVCNLTKEKQELQETICRLEKENQELKKENNLSPFERFKLASTIMEFYGDDIIEKIKGKE